MGAASDDMNGAVTRQYSSPGKIWFLVIRRIALVVERRGVGWIVRAGLPAAVADSGSREMRPGQNLDRPDRVTPKPRATRTSYLQALNEPSSFVLGCFDTIDLAKGSL